MKSDRERAAHPVDERLYSNGEAALVLQISASTLQRIRNRGEIGYFRIGGVLVFCEHQIADYKSKVERKADR